MEITGERLEELLNLSNTVTLYRKSLKKEYFDPNDKLYRVNNKDIPKSPITRTLLIDFFSGKPEKVNGKNVIKKAKYDINDTLKLKAGQVYNLKKDIETTVGRLLFNLFLLVEPFGDIIEYMNEPVKDIDDDLIQVIVDHMMNEKVQVWEYAIYLNKMEWLTKNAELFVPGITTSLMVPNPKLMAKKKELLEKYKDEIEAGNHVVVSAKIEKELLAMGKEVLEDDPAWALFELGSKPSFGNNYKNANIMMGPMYDPVKGEFSIATDNLTEGISVDQYEAYCNSLIAASYSRGVATQDGGALVKFTYSSFQSVKTDIDPLSDCGTKFRKRVKITQKNHRNYLYSFITEGGVDILLTTENINKYIGKDVNRRSPLFCANDVICHKCVGDFFRRIGVENIGLLATAPSATLMQKALKSMHDSTVRTQEIKPMDYFELVKER